MKEGCFANYAGFYTDRRTVLALFGYFVLLVLPLMLLLLVPWSDLLMVTHG